jgi:hypothetical protein
MDGELSICFLSPRNAWESKPAEKRNPLVFNGAHEVKKNEKLLFKN